MYVVGLNKIKKVHFENIFAHLSQTETLKRHLIFNEDMGLKCTLNI